MKTRFERFLCSSSYRISLLFRSGSSKDNSMTPSFLKIRANGEPIGRSRLVTKYRLSSNSTDFAITLLYLPHYRKTDLISFLFILLLMISVYHQPKLSAGSDIAVLSSPYISPRQRLCVSSLILFGYDASTPCANNYVPLHSFDEDPRFCDHPVSTTGYTAHSAGRPPKSAP